MDRRLLLVLNFETQLQTEALPPDVQKVIIGEEEQQACSSALDQDDQKPLRIKEEPEEFWASWDGEEPDSAQLPFSTVRVKSEDDERKPRASDLRPGNTEENVEGEARIGGSPRHDGGGPAPTNGSEDAGTAASDSPEPETEEDSNSEAGSEPSEKKLMSCPDCGKTFRSKSTMSKHEKIHAAEKPFTCSACGKEFRRRSHLVEHFRIHTGEKPFSCSVCGKRFSQKGNMTTHMVSHSGAKPFSCSVCGASFTQRHTLVEHARTHTGAKPYICAVCGKIFSQKRNMRRHIIEIHRSTFFEFQSDSDN